MLIVGLMSGTSADGTDAALVEIEGSPPNLSWRVLTHRNIPHSPELRAEIFACFRPETGTVDRLCTLNFALGEAFARAALDCIAHAGLQSAQIDLIGSHGQTLWHDPTSPTPSTLQLGEAAVIAERTGIPVVSNFRARDVAAGGHGAPLVAYVDRLVFTHPTKTRALQNIGGIANVTYLPPGGLEYAKEYTKEYTKDRVFAFDTGPGNMLIDDAVRRATGGAQQFDPGGMLAAQGTINEELLAELLNDPYFALLPPKTTGRERFGEQLGSVIWQQAIQQNLPIYDIIMTQTALTAFSIADTYRKFLHPFPDQVIVSGGGARNETLMKLLRTLLHPAQVMISDDLGVQIEAKEAFSFAVLAYETWHRRPSNLPAATGACRRVILGSITER